MAVPFLGNAIPRTASRATAAELRAALAAARSDAIAAGRTVVFRGARDTGYWIDDRYHRLATSSDPSMRLRVIAGAGQLSFFPWGGSWRRDRAEAGVAGAGGRRRGGLTLAALGPGRAPP